jgi:hypothetical protein
MDYSVCQHWLDVIAKHDPHHQLARCIALKIQLEDSRSAEAEQRCVDVAYACAHTHTHALTSLAGKANSIAFWNHPLSEFAKILRI